MKTSKFWHPGFTDDVKFLLGHLMKAYLRPVNNCVSDYFSHVKVFLVGHSASSNIVLKTLVELNSEDSYGARDFFSPSSPVQIVGAMCCCANYVSNG